jgi:hypothetical protein
MSDAINEVFVSIVSEVFAAVGELAAGDVIQK